MKTIPQLLFICLLMAIAKPIAADAQEDTPRIEVKYLDETPRDHVLRAHAQDMLEQKITDVSFEDASLGEAIAVLEKSAGIDFNVNWPSLELVGIDADSLIIYKASRQSIAEHLGTILMYVSADAFDDDKLSYTIQHGKVLVAPLRETKSITVRRTYNIGPLLREPYRPVGILFSEEAFEDTVAFHAWLRGERRHPMTDAAMLDVYKHHLKKMQEEVDGIDPEDLVEAKEPDHGVGLFGDVIPPDREEPNAFVQPAIAELVDLIHSSAGDENGWLDEVHKLDVNGDLLIVKAPPAVHHEIQTLLDTLLAAEIDKQANILKDAHASKQVALANARLEARDPVGASNHIQQALWIMPDHVPALAMKQLLDALEPKPPLN